MLVITPQKIGIFQAAMEKAFERDLVAYFRGSQDGTIVRLPSGPVAVSALPDSTLARMIASGVAKAKGYGLTGQAALAGYLTLMFEASPNFDVDPYLGRYLRDADVPPNARISHLLERASEEDWVAVKEAYDPRAWGVGG